MSGLLGETSVFPVSIVNLILGSDSTKRSLRVMANDLIELRFEEE